MFSSPHSPPSIPFLIEQWNVLNLMEKEESTEKCTNSLKSKIQKPKKTKKTEKEKKKKNIISLENFIIERKGPEPEFEISQETPCNRIAKYKKAGIYYCEKCAKSQTEFLIPKKQYLPSSLKKLKIEPLESFAKTFLSEIPKTKRGIVELLVEYFERNALEPVIERKTKSAAETDLITIGRNMKVLLDQVPGIEQVTTVIIENQISTIATRMKSIQAMLTQYFIMRNTEIAIEFVSSANKLKEFTQENRENNEKEKEKEKEKTTKQTYTQHKKDSVRYTEEIIQKNEYLSRWLPEFTASKKKDDLADAFLQGIWFLKKMDKIQISQCIIEKYNF
jgi:hypothetical protein